MGPSELNITLDALYILSVPEFTANLYCTCLSTDFRYTKADSVRICGTFWDTIASESEMLVFNMFLCITLKKYVNISFALVGWGITSLKGLKGGRCLLYPPPAKYATDCMGQSCPDPGKKLGKRTKSGQMYKGLRKRKIGTRNVNSGTRGVGGNSRTRGVGGNSWTRA